MNPRLVAFLLASTIAGLIAAVVTLVAGGGPFAALAANCLVGSLALLALSIVAVNLDGGGPRRPMPAARRLHA